MAYGELQIIQGGKYSVAVADSLAGYQIECNFDSGMQSVPEAEADQFFQRFLDHVATMPGATINYPSKSMSAIQPVTVTPTA